jgi:hypothetical protein
MANRAYLYSADTPDFWHRPEQGYHDSRWIIPCAWFFLYRPTDVRMIPVDFNGSSWREVKLAAEKDRAVQAFVARRPLLLGIVPGLDVAKVESFIATVRSRPGSYLLLDPAEVLGAQGKSDTWHAEQFALILTLLEINAAAPAAVAEAMRTYVGPFADDPDEVLGQVFGFTYQ